jgi:hypothetical protein
MFIRCIFSNLYLLIYVCSSFSAPGVRQKKKEKGKNEEMKEVYPSRLHEANQG